MLDTLLKQGAITVAGRDGLKRLWGQADFPDMRRVFDMEAMFSEAGPPADPLVPVAIAALASFAGAGSVHYSGPVALGVS